MHHFVHHCSNNMANCFMTIRFVANTNNRLCNNFAWFLWTKIYCTVLLLPLFCFKLYLGMQKLLREWEFKIKNKEGESRRRPSRAWV